MQRRSVLPRSGQYSGTAPLSGRRTRWAGSPGTPRRRYAGAAFSDSQSRAAFLVDCRDGGRSTPWAEATWNPVRGCMKVSPGCKHCYAESFAERFRGVAAHPYGDGFDPRLVPNKLLEPLRWPSARTVFVNSMSDLFQDPVPDKYIEADRALDRRVPPFPGRRLPLLHDGRAAQRCEDRLHRHPDLP